ncbi:MAG: hypothetical protein ACPGWR_00030 [Ardenticatenaceae bacterium]
MKTVTQTTITGLVQDVKQPTENNYLIKFVIKTIQEGEAVWLNATTTPWKGWNLKTGNEVTVTGQLSSSVWKDPFLGEEITALEMDAHEVKILAA